MRAKVLFFPAILVTGPTHSTIFLTPSNAQGLKITLLLCQSLEKIAKMINFFNHQLQLPRKCSRNVHLCIQSRVMSKNSDTQLFYWLSLKNPRKMGMVKRFYTVGVLTLMEPAFFWVSHEPGGGLISTPPCYLCPGASGRLVLNMTIVGYPLKIFLRYITFLQLKI